MTTQYYKGTSNEGKAYYYITEEDYNANEEFIEDIENQGVHVDADSSWRWHDYDFTLIKEAGYTPDSILALFNNSTTLIDNGTFSDLEVTLNEFKEAGEAVDIDYVIDYLFQSASYTTAEEVYNLVNDDPNNTIKAFTVNGYTQSDSAFIWLDKATSVDYTPKDVQEFLYDTWTRITPVDNTGEVLDDTEDGYDSPNYTIQSYGYGLNEYMLEYYKATPATVEHITQLS